MDNEDTNKITREQVERAMDAAVPQPEPWYARLVRLAQEAQSAGQACAEAEAAFKVADAEREKVRLARAAARDACHAARKALTEATTARAIVEAAQRPASVQPERPEPRYKVGDWVRVMVGGTVRPTRGIVYQIAEIEDVFGTLYYREKSGAATGGESWAAVVLAPALDPALYETARRTLAAIRSLTSQPLNVLPLPDGYMDLPGAPEWVADGSRDASPRWAAQLERLLGDA